MKAHDLSQLDDDAIRSWVVVSCSAGTYLGHPINGLGASIVLEPAFEYASQKRVGGEGIAGARFAWPLDLHSDLYRIEILQPVTITRLADMTNVGRRVFLNLVEQAEQLRANTRAAKSGLVLAPPGAQLRPVR